MATREVDKMIKKDEKTPWRDAAIMMKIGTDEDGGVIELLPMAAVLYVIKEKATYIVKTADSLDPDRKNLKIPHVNQLFMKAGALDDIFVRTVLTAKVLFSKTHLKDIEDVGVLLEQVMEIASNLVAAQEIISDYKRDLAAASAHFGSTGNGVLALPAIPGLANRIRTFHQKIEHSIQHLYRVWPAFYPLFPQQRFFEGFGQRIGETYGKEDGFSQFAVALGEFARDVRNIRHCIEHESATQQIVVSDFTVGSDATIRRPSISVVHPQSPVQEVEIDYFMDSFLENAVTSVELLTAHLAARADRSQFAFEITVAPVPREPPRRWKSSYGYFAVGQDGLIPFG